MFHKRLIRFQLTEEKLGTSEKTELDAQFESLSERSDVTKQWTERIVKNTEAVLTPNPGNRVEDFIFEKIEKKKPNRLSNLEYLGLDMVEVKLNILRLCFVYSFRRSVNCYLIIGRKWIRTDYTIWQRADKSRR